MISLKSLKPTEMIYWIQYVQLWNEYSQIFYDDSQQIRVFIDKSNCQQKSFMNVSFNGDFVNFVYVF